MDERGGRAERNIGEEVGPRRVYPPAEVQARLGVSASGLRRLAGIYERAVGPLPRDERGRVWPEEAIGFLETARAAVREQRAVSIEAALRGQNLDTAPETSPVPTSLQGGPVDVGAEILKELRALRRLVEEQNSRIGELEEAVRSGGELPAAEEFPGNLTGEALPDPPGSTPGDAKGPGGGQGPPGDETGSEGRSEPPRSWWRRLFGGG